MRRERDRFEDELDQPLLTKGESELTTTRHPPPDAKKLARLIKKVRAKARPKHGLAIARNF